MLKAFMRSLAIIGAALIAPTAQAAPTGPTYDPPISYVFSGSGISPGHAGGRTFDFTAVNTATFPGLYWGPQLVQATMDNAIDAPGETLSITSATATAAQWDGTTTALTTSGPQTVFTRFTATILPTGPTSPWLPAVAFGITDPDTPAAFQVLSPVFSVNLLFEASWDGSSYQTFYPFFDAISKPGDQSGWAQTSVNSGFFYDAPAVPLPAPLLLMGTAFGLLGLRRARRRS